MNSINVIYQFNEKYVPYAGVSITSLLINNNDTKVRIFVLGEGLSEGSKEKLSDTAKKYGADICFPDTAPLLAKFKELGMIPYRGAYSVYLRLFFTELPEFSGMDAERAIYMDADIIVDRSLKPLMSRDLEGKTTGMVLESIRDGYKVMIGMSEDSLYFNSGMIVFDIGKWRKNGYCQRIVDHIKNVRSSYIGDQDFLNIVCEGDVCVLPPAYNFQPLHARYTARQYFGAYGSDGYYTISQIEEGRKETVMYHCYRWLGEFPWNTGNLHPFDDVFKKYANQSAWKDDVSTASATGAVLRIEKCLYRLLPKPVFIRIFKMTHELMLKKAEEDAKRHNVNASA